MRARRFPSVNLFFRSVFPQCLLVLWISAFCDGVCRAGESPADKSLLTLDRIFSSAEFEPEKAPAIQWRKQGSGYTALEKAPGKDAGRQLVWHDPATSRDEVLVPAHLFIAPGESAPLAIESYSLSDDGSKLLIYTNSRRVWRINSRGDYWVLDIAGRELKRLGGDAKPSTLMFAEFSPDGTRVCYVHESNLYVQNLDDLQITRLTRDGSKTRINGTFDWVYEEELRLRKGFRWSPDSQMIAYWQINDEGVRTFYLINNTDGLYPRVIPIPYPKVGEKNPAARIGVVAASGGETRWLDVPGDPREHYIARMDWAESSEEIVLQQFNRLQNTNRVMLADAKSGRVRTILTETDKAWVENNNDMRWLDKGKRFLWLSERDGWRHAYVVSRAGDKVSLVTKGDFDVISIEAVDEENGWLYYIASPDNPTQRYLYRVGLDGRKTTRLTPAGRPGTHGYSISPDAKWAIYTYSTFDRPPVEELISLPDHKQVKVLAENKGLLKKLNTLKKPSSEFFRVDTGNNGLLDGWCIKPPDFDLKKKYPMLFYVYGEPEGQTVVDRWPSKNHLWHWMLAQQGYLVVSIDNRGTEAPRGRDWRKCIYRQIGILASADQAAATRAIIKTWPYVDPNRIAIWGWSGGGSMTLNALFRYPDLYHAGMAVAPVPNQRYYDTIYQERYMGLPGDNADGYRRGSPITYAHQLKGNLLLVHGTGDDNCHYQGVEALINELIAHNKQFTMMAYPNRTHSIAEGKNTTRHLYGLLTRFLCETMPANPNQK